MSVFNGGIFASQFAGSGGGGAGDGTAVGTDPAFTGVATADGFNENVQTVTNASTMTADLSTGNSFKCSADISQATTFEVSNAVAGQEFKWEIPIDSTGGYTLTIGTSLATVEGGGTLSLDNVADRNNLIIGRVNSSGDVLLVNAISQ